MYILFRNATSRQNSYLTLNFSNTLYCILIHIQSPTVCYTHYTHLDFTVQGYKKETTNKYRLLLISLNIYDNTPSIVPHLQSMSVAIPRIQ